MFDETTEMIFAQLELWDLRLRGPHRPKGREGTPDTWAYSTEF